MAKNRKNQGRQERRKPSRPKQGGTGTNRPGGSERPNPEREERNPGGTPADRGQGGARQQDESIQATDEQ
jgi:hypothetical protein